MTAWTVDRDGAHPVTADAAAAVALGDDDVVIAIDAVELAGPHDARIGVAAIGHIVEAGARSEILHGRQVVVGLSDPCGECDICRRGGAAACPLARRRPSVLAARVTASARWVVALVDGLVLPAHAGAVVAGSAAIAYTLYARTGVGPREPVVVTGGGAIARFTIEILIAKGIVPTVVADPRDDAWCTWLLARGAVLARVASTDDDRHARAIVTTALAAQLDGDAAAPVRETRGGAGRPWRVIATDASSLARAAALCGPRSTLTALAADPLATLPASLLANEVTVIGVAGAHPDLVVEVAALAVKLELDLTTGVELRAVTDLARPADPSRATVATLPPA